MQDAQTKILGTENNPAGGSWGQIIAGDQNSNDPRRPRYQDSGSLSGLNISSQQQTRIEGRTIEESSLLSHMQKMMRLNLEAQCYTDAIFFADKIMNLLRSRDATSCQLHADGLANEVQTGNQAAAPAGSRSLNGDSSNQSSAKQDSKRLSGVASKMNDASAQATYDLAYCYLLNGENLRCVELCENTELVFSSLKFRILVGRALLGAGNTQACLRVLEKEPQGAGADDETVNGASGTLSDQNHRTPILTPEQRTSKSQRNKNTYNFEMGKRYLLLAKAHENLENKEGATQFYREALKANCENFEAFNRLITTFLITQTQKEELIKEMSFTPENIWLKDFYLSKIRVEIRQSIEHEGFMKRKTQTDINQSSHLYMRSDDNDESGTTPPRFLSEALYNEDMPLRQAQNNNINQQSASQKSGTGNARLRGGGDQSATPISQAMQAASFVQVSVMDVLKQRNNPDVRLIEAEKHFTRQSYGKAYEIVKKMLQDDSYNVSVVPLFCAVLTELRKVGELYYLAHKLVSANADSPVAWFSVGSYYFLIKKYDLAWKYFKKANRLDKHFAPGWIAFGHAFAALDETDQAMNAYRTANRLFPGCHQASLYIGMEYLKLNSLKTALMSFNESRRINDSDPMVYNEIGVVHYKQNEFEKAQEQLAKALSLCHDSTDSTTYETIMLNSAHCHRKLKEMDSAIQAYEKCLTINPKNSQTLMSLGFTYHLMFDLQKALQYYHKAHFLNNEDSLIRSLVSKAITDINNAALCPIEATYLAPQNQPSASNPQIVVSATSSVSSQQHNYQGQDRLLRPAHMMGGTM